MLVYLLAIASGSGSLALFLTAFFLPEIHRKGDFLWSGIGLFYALVLWIMAAKVSGGLLLGETAGVAILVWAIFQVLQTRWKLVPSEQRSAPSVELVAKIEQLFSEESLQKIQAQVTALASKVKLPEKVKTTPAPAKVGSEANPEVIPPPTVAPATVTPEVVVVIPPETNPETNPGTNPETNLEPNPPATPEVMVVVTEPTSEIPVDQIPALETEKNISPPAEPILPEPAIFKIPAPPTELPPESLTPEE